jgi:signal transduction histidine kinase
MENQIDNPGPSLKLLRNQNPQTTEIGAPQHRAQKLRNFLQLQIDQLAEQSQIQWLEVVYRNSHSPDQRQVLEASQTSFPCSEETLASLQSEEWFKDLSPLTLRPIVSASIEPGFYYCPFGNQSQPNQYLLLLINGPLSHTNRQSIKRTAASIAAYLEEHQQNWQQHQQIQLLESIVQRVGHQLRHPLGLINLYSNNLKRILPKGHEQEQVAVICKTAKCLSQSLTEIMQCASSKKLQITSEDLRSLVHKTLDEFQGWITEKQIQIHCCDRPLALKLDPLQMKQALSNLLSNAIHFSPQGANISIDWQASQGNIVLTLKDEGPGLSENDLQKLFKPFYTRRKGGTGLGLAIAHKVVLDHGGKLWAKNRPGSGAEFSMSLPRFISSINLSEENTAC